MAGYQMQGGAGMQGMAMTQAQLAAAQMAAAQSGQLPKATSAQLQQQQLVAGVAPGAMPAVSAPAAAVPGMQGKMATPVRPANMQPMAAMPHAGKGFCPSFFFGTACRDSMQRQAVSRCACMPCRSCSVSEGTVTELDDCLAAAQWWLV